MVIAQWLRQLEWAHCPQPCSVPWVSYSLSSILVCSHPDGVIPKMRWCQVRSSLNWQGALKQKCLKQTCLEQGLPVIPCDICCCKSIVKITVGRRSILYVLKFRSVLKICRKVTVCHSVMFYVNLLSVFLKVYNKPLVSKCITKHINLYIYSYVVL